MNRKTLILCLCAVAFLAAVYAVAMVFLYSPAAAPGETSADSAPADTSLVRPSTPEGTSVASVDTPAADSSLEKKVSITVEPDASVTGGQASDARAIVPEGPFEVRNPDGGRPWTASMVSGNTLEMKDNSGKKLWTLELPGKISGRICSIDYYSNGKTQYLFVCGGDMYLVDRLGRVVKGFPVKLSCNVLLGPDLYDFSGLHRYNVVVLDDRNGIEMFNMKGVRPEKWKRIALKDNIIGLPEYAEKKGRSYWIVRTPDRSHIYSFYGELVKSFDGEADLDAI